MKYSQKHKTMGEIVENKDAMEERIDKAYSEAMDQVKSTSKETATEGKEGVKEAQETPMTVQPSTAITNQPAVPLSEKSTGTTITRQRKPVTTAKGVDAQSIIESMKEKIALIEWVDTVIVDEWKGTTGVKGREIITGLQKELDTLKAKYIQQIQAL